MTRDRMDRIRNSFPTLVAAIGEQTISDDLALWEHAIKIDHRFLEKPHRGYSRGFWNELLACYASDAPLSQSIQRLKLCERGLAAAAAIGETRKYAERLAEADRHYMATVAELGVVGALAPLGRYALEQPGLDAKKDYDLLVALSSGIELHVEVKYRTERPLGLSPQHRASDIALLIGDELLRHAAPQIHVTKNNVSIEDVFEIADITEKLLRSYAVQDAGPWWRVQSHHVYKRGFPTRLIDHVRRALHEERTVRMFHLDETFHVAACSPGEAQGSWAKAIIDHPLVESVTFMPPGCGIILFGVAESRALISREAIASYSGQVPRYDDDIPESKRYRDRMVGVDVQLPAGPVNLLAFAVEDAWQLKDVELAVLGEPFKEGEKWCRKGGIFDESGWERIAGVLAFYFDWSETRLRLQPKWFANRNATPVFEMQDRVLEVVCQAMATPV